MNLIRILVVTGLIFVAGQTVGMAGELTQAQKDRNAGYYLFHEVCKEESMVDLIMIVKDAPPAIGKYTKELSALAHESLDQLNQFRVRDRTIKFDPDPLPQMEIDVRKAIKADKKQQLLWDTSGPEFSRALVVTQIQACLYAKNLAEQLARRTPDPKIRQGLINLSEKWAKLADKGFELLGSKSTR